VRAQCRMERLALEECNFFVKVSLNMPREFLIGSLKSRTDMNVKHGGRNYACKSAASACMSV